jgi:HSP90 family molecular chaperone
VQLWALEQHSGASTVLGTISGRLSLSISIKALVTRLNSGTDDTRFADWANLLFEQALLAEGGQLDDPASFVRRLNGLLAMLPG